MIHIVTPDRALDYQRQLDAMFRLRYRVFKQAMDWDVQCRNGMEWDDYDEMGPVYFMALDPFGELIGGWRMLPTDGPYMLREVFRHLLDGRPAPNRPSIWEVSRFAIDDRFVRAAGTGAIKQVTREFFCALGEFSLANGISQNVCVIDRRVERLMKQVGCKQSWRTAPRRIGKTIALAAGWDVTEEIVGEVLSRSGVVGSVLMPDVDVRVAA